MLIGNAVVGQSGGPTAAINATLSGVIRGALASSAVKTVYGMRNGIEGLMDERLLALNDIFADEENLETETPQPVPDKKESNNDKGKNNNSPKKKPGAYSKFKDIFSGWIDGITEEEESDANRTEEEL